MARYFGSRLLHARSSITIVVVCRAAAAAAAAVAAVDAALRHPIHIT